jgi:hypothetical protein
MGLLWSVEGEGKIHEDTGLSSFVSKELELLRHTLMLN